MPVSPALAENLSRDVVALYEEAERNLLVIISRALGRGLDAPDWAERKLVEVRFLRRQSEVLVTKLGDRAAAQVAVSLAKAYNRGGASAASDLAALLKVSLEEVSTPLLSLPTIEILVAETTQALIAASARMPLATIEAFKNVVTESASQVLMGVLTRREAAQAALNKFAAKGITGFVDKAGRGWSLDTYAEMAMRTGTAKAAIQGHTERLQEHGLDLVIVSDAPRECPLCRPWEGKILSISGSSLKYPSMAEARSAGLWHCGCRHSASAYQEGITSQPKAKAEPEGYAASQKQRYLERQVRESKRLEVAALDDEAARKAQARVKDYQAKLRAHVAENDLKRLSYREQIGKAH